MLDLDLFLTKLADCFKRDEGPYLRIVAGREGIGRWPRFVLQPRPRGVLPIYEVPDCELSGELRLSRQSPITLVNADQAWQFDVGMVVGDGCGHEWIWGEVT